MSPKLQDPEAYGTSVLLLLKLHSRCTFLELGRGGIPPQNWTRVFSSQLVGKKKLMEFQFFHSEIFLKFKREPTLTLKAGGQVTHMKKVQRVIKGITCQQKIIFTSVTVLFFEHL